MRKQALTFLELIIVIAIFLLIITYSVPKILRGYISNELEIADQEIIHVLRTANVNSTQQVRDNSFGVQFDASGSTYTLFEGSSYASRNQNFDVQYNLPETVGFDSINLTGSGTEVLFDQVTGETSQSGTIMIIGSNDVTVTITVNSIGNVYSE